MEGSPAGVRKGSWTKVEDDHLKACVQHYGEGKWHLVPQRAGLNRCRKSCRLRWLNYLRPNIKRGDFSEDEVDLMIRLHKLLGNRWSLIAGRLPGRTSNDVKNYWNTYMRSRAQCSYRKKDKNLKPHQVIKPVPRTFSKPKPKPSSDHHSNSEVNVSSQLVAACAASSSGSTNWWETLLDDMGDDNTIALDEELVASITTNACDFLTESDQTWSDFLLNVKL